MPFGQQILDNLEREHERLEHRPGKLGKSPGAMDDVETYYYKEHPDKYQPEKIDEMARQGKVSQKAAEHMIQHIQVLHFLEQPESKRRFGMAPIPRGHAPSEIYFRKQAQRRRRR